MIGSFPPPVGGAAKNNAILHRALSELGVKTRKLDVSASSLSHHRTLAFHAQRLTRNLLTNFALFTGNQKGTLYLVPDAGVGAWYSFAHISQAVGRFDQLVIHHRSFRYIDSSSRPMAALVKAAGNKAVHVFLSPHMAYEFQRRYGQSRFAIASNARYVVAEANRPEEVRKPGPLRIGHLSNLCSDKGFFAVAKAFEAVAAKREDLVLDLAGPVIEANVEIKLAELKNRFGERVRWYGPLAGEAKRTFYRELDLFLFPTQFAQEAAPNVVYEALAAGVPTLATDRGCLPEMIDDIMGGVCPRDEDFTSFVQSYLTHFDSSPAATVLRRGAIKEKLRVECGTSNDQFAALLSLLSGQDIAPDQIRGKDMNFGW